MNYMLKGLKTRKQKRRLIQLKSSDFPCVLGVGICECYGVESKKENKQQEDNHKNKVLHKLD